MRDDYNKVNLSRSFRPAHHCATFWYVIGHSCALLHFQKFYLKFPNASNLCFFLGGTPLVFKENSKFKKLLVDYFNKLANPLMSPNTKLWISRLDYKNNSTPCLLYRVTHSRVKYVHIDLRLKCPIVWHMIGTKGVLCESPKESPRTVCGFAQYQCRDDGCILEQYTCDGECDWENCTDENDCEPTCHLYLGKYVDNMFCARSFGTAECIGHLLCF